MLLIPSADPARSWQTKTYLGKEDLHLLLANIFLYAVDKKNLRYKGDTFIVSVNPGITTTRTLKLARIEYPGNWNPEPGGWRQLAAVLRNQQKLELQVETIKPSEGNLKGNFAVAHLTGTVPFHFTDTQRTELKQFVEGGGTLIVDAAGGSGDFATAAEAELNLIFGEEAKTLGKPLPPEHKLYTAGEEALGSIAYRTLARKLIVGSLNTPRLSAIEMNGRPAVIFSRDDLSAGLVGQSVDGIIGYEPESATRIMSKILRYISDVRPQRPAN